MTVQVGLGLKNQIIQNIDESTQVKCGRDIDTLIAEVAKTNFKQLSKEYHVERTDQVNDRRVKYLFTVSAIGLSVVAVICAIASMVFASGIFTVGVHTVAVVTGFVGITSAFTLFDTAVYRFLSLNSEEKKKNTIIATLEKKFNNIKDLIHTRINTLEFIEEAEVKNQRVFDILTQIKTVNSFMEKVKIEVPQKLTHFKSVDSSPLLQHVKM